VSRYMEVFIDSVNGNLARFERLDINVLYSEEKDAFIIQCDIGGFVFDKQVAGFDADYATDKTTTEQFLYFVECVKEVVKEYLFS